jgi:hypothetical protein
MRRVALGCLLVTVSLAVVGAATALSTRAPEEFNQTLTLAGGPGARAPVDDPDAPIATARYGGERHRMAAPVAVAAETQAVPAVAMAPLVGGVEETALAGAAPAEASVATAPAAPARAAPRPAARILAEAAPAPNRPVLALTRVDHPRPNGKVLQMRMDDQPLAFTPFGLQSGGVKRLTLNASNLMSKTRASAEDLRRGRWMMFAASSGKSYGLNLIRDTIGGWRNAGYSEDKVARFGSRQIGLGWRKDNRQVALTATRRKLNAIDYSDKDTVVGVTVSVRGR